MKVRYRIAFTVELELTPGYAEPEEVREQLEDVIDVLADALRDEVEDGEVVYHDSYAMEVTNLDAEGA